MEAYKKKTQQKTKKKCAYFFLDQTLGGVLYSVEVTSTYYPVRSYWFSAVACFVAAVVYSVISGLNAPIYRGIFPSLIPTTYPLEDFEFRDFALFFLIGVIVGPLAGIWVRFNSRIMRFRKFHRIEAWRTGKTYQRIVYHFLGPYPWTLTIILLISLIQFPSASIFY